GSLGPCVADRTGGFILFFGHLDPTGPRAKRVRPDGTLDPSWGVNGRAFGTSYTQQIRAVPDGAGGAVVVLSDERNGYSDALYALRLLPNGLTAPGWPGFGTALCDSTSSAVDFDIVSDR